MFCLCKIYFECSLISFSDKTHNFSAFSLFNAYSTKPNTSLLILSRSVSNVDTLQFSKYKPPLFSSSGAMAF